MITNETLNVSGIDFLEKANQIDTSKTMVALKAIFELTTPLINLKK